MDCCWVILWRPGVEDEQVRGEEGAEGLVRGVVHPGLSHGPEEVVGMYEADGMAGSDGSISEGLSDEALAHADRSDEQDVLVAVQELEGEGGCLGVVGRV